MRVVFVPTITYLVKILPYSRLTDRTTKFEHPHFVNKEKDISILGRTLIDEPTPWIVASDCKYIDQDRAFYVIKDAQEYAMHELRNMEADSVFGIVALIAVYLEIAEKKGKIDNILPVILHRMDLAMYNLLKNILVARYERYDEQELITTIKKIDFTQKQERFIVDWIRRKINLVENFPKVN